MPIRLRGGSDVRGVQERAEQRLPLNENAIKPALPSKPFMIPGCTLTFTRSYANIHVGTGAAPTTESNPHFLHPHARRYADANDRGIGVATSEGLVVTVTFLSEQPEQGTWVATA
ncbi:MAG: hypothetical protein OEN01_13830, partial [Candidatus Krumholzibacteria bacterium]|nr:hypothetical protein [Candidatus Krumholzibacteria bacterium]